MKKVLLLCSMLALGAVTASAQTSYTTKARRWNDSLVRPEMNTLKHRAVDSVILNAVDSVAAHAGGGGGGGTWGSITGTLSAQTDLNTALGLKLTASSSLNATNLLSGTIPAARYGTAQIPVTSINASGTANSTTYLRGDGAWTTPAGGGGGGSSAPDIYAVDYGVVNDTTVNNTSAIQSAINAATVTTGLGNKRRVVLPNGEFIVDSLTIPAVDPVTGLMITIELVGASEPAFIFGTVPNPGQILPHTNGTIIRTRRTTGGALLRALPFSGGFSLVHVILRDIDFRLYDNPSISCIDMGVASQLSCYNLFVNTNTYNPNCAQPTHVASTGIITPRVNNGAWTILSHVAIAGYYIGVENNEHVYSDYSAFASNKWPIAVQGAYHESHYTRIGVYTNQHFIRSDGIAEINIDMLDFEHETGATTTQAWQLTVDDIYDPSNALSGHIYWHDVTGGYGVSHNITLVGGKGLTVTQSTQLPSWRDTTDATTYRLSKLTSPFTTYAQIEAPSGGSYQAGVSFLRGGTTKWNLATNYNGSANDLFLFDAAAGKPRIYFNPNGEVQIGNDAFTTPTAHFYPNGALLLNTPSSTGQALLMFQKNGTSVWQFGTDIAGSGNPDFYIFDQLNGQVKFYGNNGAVSLGGNANSTPAIIIPNTSGLPIYANDAAADAALPSKALYKITGSRVVYQVP